MKKDQMVKCPVCLEDNEKNRKKCKSCGEDLKSLQKLRELPLVYYNQGLSYARESNYILARNSLLMAVELNRDFTEAYQALAKVCMQQNQPDEAREYWERVLKLSRDNEDARRGLKACEVMASGKEVRSIAQPAGWNVFATVIPVIAALLIGYLGHALFSGNKVNENTVVLSIEANPKEKDIKMSEHDLKGPLERIFGSNREISSLDISIKQEANNIVLSGNVPSYILKASISDLARKVKGVNLIDDTGINVVLPPRYHKVRPGDTLSLIADKIYGDTEKWTVIYEANKNVLKDPNFINTGRQILIPYL